MAWLPWCILIAAMLVLLLSLFSFIRIQVNDMHGRTFSQEVFIALLIIYSTIIIGFGMMYFILSFQGVLLVEDGKLDKVEWVGSLIHSLYFSGVTMLTIGYGDITPIGIGRLIAVVQALIGYVLPAAFVLQLVHQHVNNEEDE
ncbi:potassium channel family protein [Ornithinibacillus gellani]|uniref:potassium channel family protein n=1 Tax=Ornithinibacillus gellani TaxID=2293253 RepID=UPI001CC1F1FD|nr:potassium channel family protein [Ornithinibacillus gellani]